jgi:hypothetical protein
MMGVMIKFVQCVRRKPGLSKQEFREEWMRYGELVKEIAGASQAARCLMSTALQVDQNLDIMQSRGTKAPYDGMVEIWWGQGAGVVAFMQTSVARKRSSWTYRTAPSSSRARKPRGRRGNS